MCASSIGVTEQEGSELGAAEKEGSSRFLHISKGTIFLPSGMGSLFRGSGSVFPVPGRGFRGPGSGVRSPRPFVRGLGSGSGFPRSPLTAQHRPPFTVQGSEFGIQRFSGLGVKGFRGPDVRGSGFRFPGSELGVKGSRFTVQKFRGSGP